MLKISIDKINLLSPYEVTYADDFGALRFITNQGRTYRVGFVEESLMSFPGVYQFFIQADTHTRNDAELFATIISILEIYFESGALALSYICDTRDGRQSARNRLFISWFNNYPFNSEYTFINKRLEVEDTEYYISLIVRMDDPLSESVLSEFKEVVAELENEDKLV